MFNWDDPLAEANPNNQQDAIANIPPANLNTDEAMP